jgi:hypothetical protein
MGVGLSLIAFVAPPDRLTDARLLVWRSTARYGAGPSVSL